MVVQGGRCPGGWGGSREGGGYHPPFYRPNIPVLALGAPGPTAPPGPRTLGGKVGVGLGTLDPSSTRLTLSYSPLAGGFLTGHVSLKADLKGTRYEETNKFGNNFRAIYDKPKLHDAIRELHSVCQSNNVTLAEVSLRWLVYHSKLRKEDAVILGASKISQIESNIKDIRQGPLSEQLLKAVEELAAVSLEMMRGSPYGPD